MNKVFISLVVLFVGIGSILVVQAMQTSTSIVYMPSELADGAVREVLPRVRVAGKVSANKMDYQIEPEIRLSFYIQDPEGDKTAALEVEYRKLMPDMFAPGRSVIIDGEFRDGVLYASHLLTQCPSKYEPPTPMGPSKSESSTSVEPYKPEPSTPMDGTT